MHYLYFVAKKKEKEDKKEDIASEVENQLNNEGFAGEGGYWVSCKSDWFVMGGRWSGELQKVKMDNWHDKALEIAKKGRPEEDNDRDFITQTDIERNNAELQELWEKLGGTGRHCWDRNRLTTGETYFEDDTMLLDEELYKGLVDKDYDEVEVAVMEDGWVEEEMLLKDFLKNKENVVGNYWICVVDYHS